MYHRTPEEGGTMYYLCSRRNGVECGGWVTIGQAEAELEAATSLPGYVEDVEFDYKLGLYIRYIPEKPISGTKSANKATLVPEADPEDGFVPSWVKPKE